MDSVYNWIMLNGMILLNVIMGFIETVCDKVDVALKAIKDSSVSDILIFRNRNESPWLVKENALPVLKGSHLHYSMTDKKFYEFVSSTDLLKMDDIIMAELVDSSGKGVCDMSEFFHAVKWASSSPPSVYELVLTNLLINRMCLSKEYLSKCVLNVTTLENPSLTIKMNNPLARDNFISWNVFSPLEPSRPITLSVPVFVTAPVAIREEASASLAPADASSADASSADASLSPLGT